MNKYRVILVAIIICPLVIFGQTTTRYEYDNLGRLTKATNTSGDQIFEYDELGNRTVYRIVNNNLPSLQITPLTQIVDETEGTASFHVAKTGVGEVTWSVEAEYDWVTITSQPYGTNDGEIAVSYLANPDTQRTGIINVISDDIANSPIALKVIQKSGYATPYLSVSPLQINASATSGSFSLNIENIGQGDMLWNAQSNEPWINIINNSTGINMGIVEVTYTGNNGLPRIGIITVTSESASNSPIDVEVIQADTRQTVLLANGWNIFSFYNSPESPDMQNIMQPLIDSELLIKVQDEKGYSIEYLPGVGWVNSMDDWMATEGYYIKVEAVSQLTNDGDLIEMPLTIPLAKGWSIISYPMFNEQNALTVVQHLVNANQLIKIQDERGYSIESIEGIGWINSIGNFVPGEGYYIKVSEKTDLTLFNSSSVNSNSIQQRLMKTSSYFDSSFEGNPFEPMNIYLTITDHSLIDKRPIVEIAAFDNGICVGKVALPDSAQFPVLLIAGMNDPLTSLIDGFTFGSEIEIRGWDGSNEYIYEYSAPHYFQPRETAVLNLESVVTGIDLNKELVKSYQLFDCYPNPFNPSTTIKYSLPEESRVVLTVYNILGQLVKTLVSSTQNAGSYLVNWNGDNDNSTKVAGGVYIYSLVTDTYRANKKMVLLK